MQSVPQQKSLVVGLGVSGRAIARHLTRLKQPFIMADTREYPPGLEAFRAELPGVEVHCGDLADLDFDAIDEVVLSPGVAPDTRGLEKMANRTCATTGGPSIIGEIALFSRACQVPVAAITGSNAKSTVTTLLGDMARDAGVKVAVGGNLGTPALDLLHSHPDAELFVLELSSFQLETTPLLGATTAAFLNLSDDHLDRHGNMQRYRLAKQAIFQGASHALVNADDSQTWPLQAVPTLERFTTQPPGEGEWGVAVHQAQDWLMHGEQPLIPCRSLRIRGRHNQANALAALAMGTYLGLPRDSMLETLKHFPGLPHRGEWVADLDGVAWINDSKGTNVGATLAAIEGLGPTLSGRLILLAGGVGKGADFTPLAEPLARYAREAVLFGRDASLIQAALGTQVPVMRCDDLDAAMQRAQVIAQPGDVVLLSPACASLDQFANYEARGELFRRWVMSRVRGQE